MAVFSATSILFQTLILLMFVLGDPTLIGSSPLRMIRGTTPVFVMAMFLWCGLPIPGWICLLIGMKFSPLTREKMVEVQEKMAGIKEKG